MGIGSDTEGRKEKCFSDREAVIFLNTLMKKEYDEYAFDVEKRRRIYENIIERIHGT